ncbi:bifunctional hydroxymethylpyrimidine kinase/phosphomethylpyrimidine kinase [Egicoccus sp. AB-alg2]|uniref:bifunctional hydroxymethylpyrimidine kinase/phosphomethylpyrimidine kinase n=1 Tax=Egicoccus sp. AB-alg2 TaxID=3242693 RepID=UPI00359ED0EF
MTDRTPTPAVALTIAGSDSGGGAGLQADLRAFAAMGTFGASVVTAVTAQNTRAVTDVHVVPAQVVRAQLDAVLDDLPVAAVKTGMLATSELVALVADQAAAGRLPQLVVDPVLVSATGHRLLEPDAVATYRERLLPHAAVVTPNLPEAAALLERAVDDLDAARAAARDLAATGAGVVVVKGGHLDGGEAVDVVIAGGEEHLLSAPRIPTANLHGTGCTFAAATAAGLASGLPPLRAVERAKSYVTGCIARAADWRLGAGAGPLDHLGITHAAQADGAGPV